MNATRPSAPLACDLDALNPQQRRAHARRTASLFRQAEAVYDVPGGLGLRFRNEKSILLETAAFIANEQLCCPFLKFELRVEPQEEQIRLSLSGDRNTQSFLRMEFADLLESRVQ